MVGVLNILKPPHMTSHDVVAIARGVLGEKKIGHTGTLDPMAAGVLVLCVGKATKIVEILQNDKKLYKCALVLGSSTDTQDAWGNVVEKFEVPNIDIDIAKKMVEPFIGEIYQVPPMYSAIKVGGKKLYEIARRGQSVERKGRKCCIHNIDILRVEGSTIWIDVHCSKGTYIRTLCHDIGQSVGCGAYMGFLLRLKTGEYSIDTAITMEEFIQWGKIAKKSDENILNQYDILKPLDHALSNLKKIDVPIELYDSLKNGIKINLAKYASGNAKENQLYRVYAGEFIGVAKCIGVDFNNNATKIIMEKNLF